MKRTKTRTPSYDRNGNGSINRHSVNQHESTDNQPSMNQQIFAFGPGIFPSLVYCIYIYILYNSVCSPQSASPILIALRTASRTAPSAHRRLLVARPGGAARGGAQRSSADLPGKVGRMLSVFFVRRSRVFRAGKEMAKTASRPFLTCTNGEKLQQCCEAH